MSSIISAYAESKQKKQSVYITSRQISAWCQDEYSGVLVSISQTVLFIQHNILTKKCSMESNALEKKHLKHTCMFFPLS